MAEIVTYSVIEPPTSREVMDRISDALAKDRTDAARGVVRLTLLADQQVPKPDEQDIEFIVKRMHDHDLHGLKFVGPIATEGFGFDLVVQLAPDLENPATANTVV